MPDADGAVARYDGLADWYDRRNAAAADANRDPVRDLLGPEPGLCLDLGCGTGQNLRTLRAAGRTLVGLDRSGDQLRLARRRTVPGEILVQGDAAALPFADAVFTTVAALWLSTDVDDVTAVLREAARVLRPGGALVFYGAHPCFCGPHAEALPDGSRLVHATYRQAGLHRPAPWWGHDGIRSRLGMRHTPLADLLTGFAAAGLAITRAVEPHADPVPAILGLRAEKPPSR